MTRLALVLAIAACCETTASSADPCVRIDVRAGAVDVRFAGDDAEATVSLSTRPDRVWALHDGTAWRITAAGESAAGGETIQLPPGETIVEVSIDGMVVARSRVQVGAAGGWFHVEGLPRL